MRKFFAEQLKKIQKLNQYCFEMSSNLFFGGGAI